MTLDYCKAHVVMAVIATFVFEKNTLYIISTVGDGLLVLLITNDCIRCCPTSQLFHGYIATPNSSLPALDPSKTGEM